MLFCLKAHEGVTDGKDMQGCSLSRLILFDAQDFSHLILPVAQS